MDRRPTICPPGAVARGFTLIEMMIVVVLVAILAGVALPSLLEAIRKNRRSEAISAINAVQQAQERWRSSNASYASDLTSAAPAGLGIPATTSSGYYTLSLGSVTATGYTITATANSGTTQANDGDCAQLRVRADGGNLYYGFASLAGSFSEAVRNRCWSR